MIYLTGDIHGDLDIKKLNHKNFKEATENDYLIILGDFGLIWTNGDETPSEKWWLDWLNDKPWTTVVILGNHDNWPEVRRRYEVIDFNGAVGYKIRDKIIVIERGEIFTLEEQTFFAFGGGFSIDAYRRTLGITWWEEELPTVEEVNKAINKLQNRKWNVDYVITHDIPKDMVEEFGFFPKANTMNLYEVDRCDIQNILSMFANGIEFKHWYSGHFHIDKTIDKFTILYDKIVSLGLEV